MATLASPPSALENERGARSATVGPHVHGVLSLLDYDANRQ